MLTSAIVQGREEIQDPIRNMVLHYRGEGEASKRNVLTANEVSQDVNGLNQLIRAGCLRAAINLTSRLLTRSPFSTQHSPVSLRIWHVRIALMLKLKQFTTVETEAAAFGNLENVDLYYQHYPEQYGDRQGTMVPFGLRVLLAELPLHLGKHLEAMDRLYGLLAKVNRLLRKGDNFLRLLQNIFVTNKFLFQLRPTTASVEKCGAIARSEFCMPLQIVVFSKKITNQPPESSIKSLRWKNPKLGGLKFDHCKAVFFYN